jgi:site-specific DNA-methyltransferase (adenine-specific)
MIQETIEDLDWTAPKALINGDCMEVLPLIPDASIDLVLCDPPYGTTLIDWDKCIPIDWMWAHLKRIAKQNAPIILFAAQPFTSKLIVSNEKQFKHCLVWRKSKCGSPLLAKYRPMMKHEDVVVFGNGRGAIPYYPQMLEGEAYYRKRSGSEINNVKFGIKGGETRNEGTRYPDSILDFPQKWRRQDQVHPTQKPVELMEWLIKSYSKPCDVVLDFTAGSGPIAVATANHDRGYIGIEMEKKYHAIAVDAYSRAIHERSANIFTDL